MRDEIFLSMSCMPSPEGATRDKIDSAVVSPLQSSDSTDDRCLSCPEKPEELPITVEAPEGSPQPGVGLPTTPGVPSPIFPRVGDLMVRRSPDLVPLMLQLFIRMDHLSTQIDCHRGMLDCSRHDLHCMGHVVENVLKACDIDPGNSDVTHHQLHFH